MGLLDKLISGQASNTSLNGQTPNVPNFGTSTLQTNIQLLGTLMQIMLHQKMGYYQCLQLKKQTFKKETSIWTTYHSKIWV